MAPDVDADIERSSRDVARLYPTNITHTVKSPHALKAYNDRFLSEGAKNYVKPPSQWAVFLWDLEENAKQFCLQPKIQTLEDLMGFMEMGTRDPRSRFAFIQTAGSRGPLCCSLDQLAHLLTHHEVMPAFLDFALEFKKRGSRVDISNWFRVDDCLPSQTQLRQQANLGRSGLRIQHCFNIMTFEFERKEKPGDPRHPSVLSAGANQARDIDEGWFPRHTTVYHSLYPVDGRSMWIVIKGNKSMRERLIYQSDGSEAVEEQTPGGQFRATLRTHLHILEWCTENWSQYIEYFEQKSRKHSTAARHAPVEDLADAACTMANNQRPLESHVPDALEIPRFVKVFSGLSGVGRKNTVTNPPGQEFSGDNAKHPGEASGTDGLGGSELENKKEIGVDFDQTFKFKDQQDILRLTEELEKASLVIDENLKILGMLKQRYMVLYETRKEFRAYQSEVYDFALQVGVLEGDLRTQQTRINTLSHQLEKHEEMFNRALEYRNMKTGISYSLAAQRSAIIMERYTESMHHMAEETELKATSMHAITIMGFMLLPCTFASTFLSSAVIDFENPTDGAFLGDWTLRRPALWLFLILSLMLMVLTVPVWFAVYYYGAKLQRGKPVNFPRDS